MICECDGDLLAAGTDALVNAVNTAGVMGKGIALQFRQTYPAMFDDYVDACRRHELRLGRMYLYRLSGTPRWIISFPTKGHWRDRSQLSDVEAGLRDLVSVVQRHGIASVAIPALGCGNGGLDWDEVRPLIIRAFADLPGVDVRLYPPFGQGRSY